MPYYTPDDDPEKTKPKRACDGLRQDLKKCLLDSDCVRKEKRTPKDCLMSNNDPSVPDMCYALRVSFFECKRSVIDMRSRFRGVKGY